MTDETRWPPGTKGRELILGMKAPYYDNDGITIYHGDCFEIMAELDASSVDHVISDPPYTDHVFKSARKSTNSGPGAMEVIPGIDGQEEKVASEGLRLARRWVVLFCAFEQLGFYARQAEDAWIRSGVWRKPNVTPQFTGDRPGICGEALAIMHRPGKKRWNGGGYPAYWEHNVPRERHGHPTTKPLSLMLELIEQFTDPEETILDPFMGSGTTLRAAKDLRRRAIGIEIEEKYCEIAVSRLQQIVLPL